MSNIVFCDIFIPSFAQTENTKILNRLLLKTALYFAVVQPTKEGTGHKVLTYVEYRAVPGVFQNIDPPTTLSGR
jgi:hypothetical protein